MRKLRIVLTATALTILVGTWASPASAQSATDGSAAIGVSVTFSRALLVIAGDPIVFGDILINGNAGTVTIDKLDGTLTGSGGALDLSQSISQRGFISFIGPRPGTVGITYATSVNLIHSQDPTSVVTFTPSSEVSTKVINDYNENVQIFVGGALNFGLNTKEGLYEGSVVINVGYS